MKINYSLRGLGFDIEVLTHAAKLTEGYAIIAYGESYAYDPIARTVSTTYPSGKVLVKTMDARGRLNAIDFGGVNVLSNINYDHNRKANYSLGNGINTTASNDLSGRLTGLDYSLNGTSIYSLNVGLNTNGMVENIDRSDSYSDEEVNYYPDGQIETNSLGEFSMVDGLTSFTKSSANNWNYDSRGNWLSYNDETRTPTVTNEIASISDGINEFTLLYDGIGNLISDGTMVLTWTVDGLLESVTAADVNINITYDALNRRVEKKVYINEMLNKTTEYIYDNWKLIEERSGANVKSFVYGDYIDEVVYIENNGVGYYPLRGVNFNIEALTNSSGDLVETYAIDAFGNFKVFDADGVEKALSDRLNSILHQGRDYDDDVGLYYFRNRWYSAEQGRFISRDPIRYRAGDINLYRFVGNDPVNGLDPYGLKVEYGNGRLSPSDINVINGTVTPQNTGNGVDPAFKSTVDQSIKQIISTPKGNQLLYQLETMKDASGNDVMVYIHENNTGDFFQYDAPNGTMYVSIDPSANPNLVFQSGSQPVSTIRALAHELGHCTGTLDDGPANMNNILAWENPIMTPIDGLIRIQY